MTTLKGGSQVFDLAPGEVLTVSAIGDGSVAYVGVESAVGTPPTVSSAPVTGGNSTSVGPFTVQCAIKVYAIGRVSIVEGDGGGAVSGAWVEVLSSTGEPSDVLTGSTTPERLASWYIPAGYVREHDTLLLLAKATNSNSANVKYLSLYVNDTEVAQLQNTTNTNMSVLWTVGNKGSLLSQIGMRLNNAGIGAASGAIATSAVNLTNGFELSVRGWTLTSTAETLVMESHTLMLIRGV